MSPHGTTSRYVNGKCRCEECKNANREYQRKLRLRLAEREPKTHGTVSTYENWACRCDACVAAAAEAWSARGGEQATLF